MMKINKWTSRVFAFCLGIAMIFAMIPNKAQAREPMSITVKHEVDGEPISGIGFSIYRVAEFEEDRWMKLTGAFAEYHVELNNLDSAGWKYAAETLSGYCLRDELTPLQEAQTNEKGEAVLDAEGVLTEAVYLIIGQNHDYKGKTYTIQPLLIAMPIVLGEDVQYEVEVSTKYEVLEETETLTVAKVWKDDPVDHEDAQVTIQLINRLTGNIHDEVTLSEENNWRYTWTDLPEDGQWLVVEEEVGEDYVVSVEQEGAIAIVTNTHKEMLPEEPGEPDTPIDPDDPETPSDPGKPSEPQLPQTGMLWWPVPVLAAAGLVCLLIGLMWRRQYE